MRKFVSTLLCLAAVSFASEASAGPFTFSYHVIDNFGDRMGQTSLVDVDRDGDLDWISGSASGSGGGVWWWEYKGPDNWVRHPIGTGSTDVGGAAFDVNGDGWVDQLSGRTLLLNPGDPRNKSWIEHKVGTIHSHDTEFADVNGDGKMDVVANSDSRGLFWYEISSDPTKEWTEHTIATSSQHKVHGGPSPRAVGDIDGDGDNDVVTARGWYENLDGHGTSWKPHLNIDFGEEHQHGIAVRTWLADLDKDGDLDVIQSEADNPDGRVAWFENDGKGNWTRHIIKNAGDGQDFHALAVADFDNDGDLDVFAAGGPMTQGREANTKSYIWENRGNASTWVEHIVATKPCHEVEVADVDKDGDIDIACKPWKSGDEHFYLQNLLNESGGGNSNQAPVAEPQSLTVEAGAFRSIVLTATDADGDALSYSIQAQPTHGALSGSAPTVTYTPSAGYTGPDSFTFRVSDGEAQSAIATVSLVVEDTSPPSTPGGLMASPSGPSQIDLSWNDSEDAVGVSGYLVFRDGSEIATTGTTHFVDSGLEPATQYTYRIRAIDAAGNVSGQSSAVSATTGGGGSDNARPVASDGSAKVEAGDVATIIVQASDADSDPLTYVIVSEPEHGVLSGSGPEYEYEPEIGFAGSDVFTFRASDGQESSNIATIEVEVVDTTPPSKPGGLVAVSAGTTQIELTWNASSDAVGVVSYSVIRDGSKVADAPGTSFTDTNLEPGTTYQYRVAALDGAGNESALSGQATAVTEEDTADEYVMSLYEGWNLVSSLVMPDTKSLAALFDAVLDDLILVKDEEGRAFMPELGIHDLTEWDETEAYLIYVGRDLNVRFVGEAIQPASNHLAVTAGWNQVPFFLPVPQAVDDALASLGDDVVILKDHAGRIYYPTYGIDQVGVLEPGKGYFLYLQEKGTLVYQGPGGKTSLSNASEHAEGIPVSATLLVEAPALGDGAVIEVRGPAGRVLGRGTVVDGRAVVTVPGDEPLTAEISEGAEPGQELTLQVLRDDEPLKLRVAEVTDALAGQAQVGELRYRHNAVLVVRSEQVASGREDHPSELAVSLSQNYPNPFVHETHITFALAESGHVRLEVYNLNGQLVTTLVDGHREAGTHVVRFENEVLGSGTYLYRLNADGRSYSRGMTLMR